MVTLEDKKDGCSTDLYFEKQERGRGVIPHSLSSMSGEHKEIKL